MSEQKEEQKKVETTNVKEDKAETKNIDELDAALDDDGDNDPLNVTADERSQQGNLILKNINLKYDQRLIIKVKQII